MKVGDLVRPRYPSEAFAARLGVPLSHGICGIVVEHFYSDTSDSRRGDPMCTSFPGAVKVMFSGGKVIPFSAQGLVLISEGEE